MLEHLFGSKTRVKLLRLFLNNPQQPYYLRELARKVKVQLNSIRREVNNLEKIGIIKSVKLTEPEPEGKKKKKGRRKKPGSKKYYLADADFILHNDLKILLLKSQILLEKDFIKKIEKIAKVKLFLLAGFFVGDENFITDILLVGLVNKPKLAKLIRKFEKELNHNINYTVMSFQEFKYRQDITDRFLYDILEGDNVVVIDKIFR